MMTCEIRIEVDGQTFGKDIQAHAPAWLRQHAIDSLKYWQAPAGTSYIVRLRIDAGGAVFMQTQRGADFDTVRDATLDALRAWTAPS